MLLGCPDGFCCGATQILLPSSTHDPASMVAQALSIYGAVSGKGPSPAPG